MKKIALLMALIMLFSFSSCGKKENDDASEESSQSSSDEAESSDSSEKTEGSSSKNGDKQTAEEGKTDGKPSSGDSSYTPDSENYNGDNSTNADSPVSSNGGGGNGGGGGNTSSSSVSDQTPGSDNPNSLPPNNPISNVNFKVTICAPVATGVYIVGGTCASDCNYMLVTGGASQEKIYPDYNNNGGYYIGQVKIKADCTLSVYQVSNDGSTSSAVTKQVKYKQMNNLMESDDYMPVFGKNSMMHFYSSLLVYSLSGKVSQSMKNAAKQNISRNVETANSVGAKIIYLIVPSSASVYPETVPDGYSAATGESIFDSFKSIAEGCGATVVYPLDTFKAHKNDGKGYKIYHNTDSHWTTYGAYWGLSALCGVISQKFPAAKARTVSEMGFYTQQLCGGDALFSFGDNGGFENYSITGITGVTSKTKINELTTLYSLKTPTNTISGVYRNNKSVYVDGINSSKATVNNSAGSGLPTAVVVRDSFGCTIYDMFNERFSTVYWQPSHVYSFPANDVTRHSPDYVIYIVSERNIPKIMLENENFSVMSMR